ncbi:GDYXXLXY domain-containing protein [Paenibacillus sp. BR2-3]|uniref:GDYXXLXY domain-containing protein n=1 Tax=Paenibacillus sp. BR2-3 TaxID=3048494 RepID=UPI003977348E
MFRLNGVRTGLTLGVSLVLAAIIYFFAANWGGLDRIEKVFVSAGLVLMFYVVSYALTRFKALPALHAFLSNVFLLGGYISFGTAVALLHQIYNSHADSYTIFMIWAVPAILFAWITRYNPFYVLSYALVHLSLWLYFFPSSMFVVHSEETLMFIGILFAVINLILFALTEMNRLKSAPLRVISFIIFHVSLLVLTNSWEFETYGGWMNIACVAAIGMGFYYFIHIRLNKSILTLNALAASAFAVFKFIELATRHASIAFFFFGLVFVALLLTCNVWFFRTLNKLGNQSPEDAEETPRKKSGDHNHVLVGRVVSVIVTIVGVFIGSVSLIGIVLVASDLNYPEYSLLALALLFIIPMILLPRLNPVVRYTVLTIGYITGMISIVWIDKLGLSVFFIVLSIAGWIRLKGSKQRFFIYGLLNVNVAVILFELLEAFETLSNEFTWVILLLSLLNAVLYALHFTFPESPLRQHVRTGALFFSLLFLFWLTFLGDIFPYSYEVFNILNFTVVTLLVFGFLRREQSLETGLSLIFWFAFLVYKYYDLFWSLLHKSITLALLGVIAITVSYIIARRTDVAEIGGMQNGLLRRNVVLIAIVILVQFGFLGVQAVRSEVLLTTGTTVKLEITPLDPRSLLQGDYIVLNYSISNPPEPFATELEDYRGQHKVKVVLSRDDRGVYVLNRFYKSGEALSDAEVVINGKLNGWGSIRYGIETFFVPEGTGLDVQSKAKFATIRVNAQGDALIEALTEQ